MRASTGPDIIISAIHGRRRRRRLCPRYVLHRLLSIARLDMVQRGAMAPLRKLLTCSPSLPSHPIPFHPFAAASRWVPKWAVGENVEALWRDDGQWYRGWIEGLDFVTRTYTIIFETYMNRQDQTRDSQIRPDSSPGTARTAVADFLISPALLSGRTPSPPPTTAPSLAPIAVSVAAHAAPAAPQSHPRSDSDALRISQPKGPDGGALAAMASQFDQCVRIVTIRPVR